MKNGLPAAARWTSAARAPALAPPASAASSARGRLVQAPDGEPLDEVVAAQVGHEVGEVLVVAGVDAAGRAEDEDGARLGVAQHVGEQGRGAGIDPVDVVDDEQHRPDPRLRVDERGHGFEQPEALDRRIARRRGGRAEQLGEQQLQPFVGAEHVLDAGAGAARSITSRSASMIGW